MSDYLSYRARRAKPYVAGEQPKDRRYIKLNTNENPYPPSPEAIAAMQQEMQQGMLNRYPDPSAQALREGIAARFGVSAEQIFVGNGSDEILALTYLAFFNAGQRVATPEIGYSFYPVYADLFEVELVRVPMREDFHVDVEALLDQGAPVLLANPNAPTSLALDIQTLEYMAARLHVRGQLLVVDEAYVDFGAQSALALLAHYDNVLIVRTLSKAHSLAGMRVGFAIGSAALVDGLLRMKDSFNSYPLDRIAQAGALAAIQDEAYFQKCCDAVKEQRENFVKGLKEIGFSVLPSAANFVFASHEKYPAKELFACLKQRGVLVRYFSAPKIDNHLRITIGTRQEMEQTLEILREILSERNLCVVLSRIKA